MPAAVIKKQITLESFDEIIYQEDRRKIINMQQIKQDRKINKLMIIGIIAGIIYIFSIGMLYLSSGILLKTKEDEIRRCETILQNKRIANEQLVAKIEEIVVDKGIKEKAILELSMTKPTENHIIYFDKTDRGYIHYDRR